MMKRLTGIFILSCFYSIVHAQTFGFDLSKKKDPFSYNFLIALNDAPFRFGPEKGKLLNKADSIHLKSAIYNNKIPLPGATASRFVQDSTIYLEYFFGEFADLDDATEQLTALTNKVSKAMNKHTVVLKHDWGTESEIIKENKISYALHSGFFHYNISAMLTKVKNRDTYRLVLQLYSGKPFYYNWIMKNEPYGGFNFINYVKKTFTFFDSYSSGCPTDIPGFACKGKTEVHDTTVISYVRSGFDGLMNARTEYDVTFSNLRAGLSSEYVYYNVPYKSPCLRKIAFVRFEDVDKSKRKTLLLSFLEQPKTNGLNAYQKKEQVIDLSFAY
jgi:hypothetical protein